MDFRPCLSSQQTTRQVSSQSSTRHSRATTRTAPMASAKSEKVLFQLPAAQHMPACGSRIDPIYRSIDRFETFWLEDGVCVHVSSDKGTDTGSRGPRQGRRVLDPIDRFATHQAVFFFPCEREQEHLLHATGQQAVQAPRGCAHGAAPLDHIGYTPGAPGGGRRPLGFVFFFG